jgi:hypothetical protein
MLNKVFTLGSGEQAKRGFVLPVYLSMHENRRNFNRQSVQWQNFHIDSGVGDVVDYRQ